MDKFWKSPEGVFCWILMMIGLFMLVCGDPVNGVG